MRAGEARPVSRRETAGGQGLGARRVLGWRHLASASIRRENQAATNESVGGTSRPSKTEPKRDWLPPHFGSTAGAQTPHPCGVHPAPGRRGWLQSLLAGTRELRKACGGAQAPCS